MERKPTNRIYLKFGKQAIAIDPIEFLLLLMLSMPIGITISDRHRGNLDYSEAMKRILEIAAYVAGVRIAPTGKLSDWATRSKSIDKEVDESE
jgi:hypothetical protein